MAILGISDLLTFAKSGWTPAAVKEIMALDKQTEEAPDSTAKESESTEAQNVKEEKPDASSIESENSSDNAVPDYKKLFEEQQKQIDELSKKLEAAQKANTQADVSNSATKVSAQETVNNIFRDVIS